MAAIREIAESHVNSANGDVEVGHKNAADQIVRLVEEGKVAPRDVSIKEIFEVFVKEPQGLSSADYGNTQLIAEAMLSSAYPYITGRLIHQELIAEYETTMGNIEALVHVTDSTHQEEDIAGLESDYKLLKVPEGRRYEEGKLDEKRVRIKNTKFGRIIALTKEDVLFDKTGALLDRAKRIGYESGIHRHRFIAEKIQDVAVDATGEAANTSLVYDGTARAIFADTHAAWDTYANDNNETTAFGDAGVSAVFALLSKMRRADGSYITFPIAQIFAPAALNVAVTRFLKNPYAYGGTTWDVNIFQGAWQAVFSPWCDAQSTTKYYLGNFPLQYWWLWVWKPLTEQKAKTSESAFYRDVVLEYKHSYMGGCGAVDYRFVAKGGT